jgi:hypothetical protein
MYNPSYLGGRGRKISRSRPALEKVVARSCFTNKRAGDMAQVMEYFPSICEGMDPIPRT